MDWIDIIKPLSTVLSSSINKSQQHQEKNCWECRELNPGLLGEKQVCYLRAMHPSLISFVCDQSAEPRNQPTRLRSLALVFLKVSTVIVNNVSTWKETGTNSFQKVLICFLLVFMTQDLFDQNQISFELKKVKGNKRRWLIFCSKWYRNNKTIMKLLSPQLNKNNPGLFLGGGGLSGRIGKSRERCTLVRTMRILFDSYHWKYIMSNSTLLYPLANFTLKT